MVRGASASSSTHNIFFFFKKMHFFFPAWSLGDGGERKYASNGQSLSLRAVWIPENLHRTETQNKKKRSRMETCFTRSAWMSDETGCVLAITVVNLIRSYSILRETEYLTNWKTTPTVMSAQLNPAAVHQLFSWCPAACMLEFCFVATFLPCQHAVFCPSFSSHHLLIPGLPEKSWLMHRFSGCTVAAFTFPLAATLSINNRS